MVLVFFSIHNLNNGTKPDWLIVIITLAGIIIALWQFISYRNELKNKMFIEFRQRFKSDSLNIAVLEFISDSDRSPLPTTYAIYHFLGYYDELHKMYCSRLISKGDLIYFFYAYLDDFTKCNALRSRLRDNSEYWTRIYHLYEVLSDNSDSYLTKLKNRYKLKRPAL